MGNICQTPTNTIAIQEIDLAIKVAKKIPSRKYKSAYDTIYDKFDKNFNLLKYIPLSEFLLMFSVFKVNKATTASGFFKKNLFLEEFEKDSVILFFEHKIINNHLLVAFQGKEKPEIFKDFISILFDALMKGYISYIKKRDPKLIKKSTNPMKMKKLIMMALGFVFCQADVHEKGELFHYAFSNQKNQLENSDNVEAFVYFLFLISSFAAIKTITELSNIYPEIGSEIDALSDAISVFEVNDIINLKNNYINDLFEGMDGISHDDLVTKMSDDNLDWIFSSKGIRFHLEKKKTKKD